MLKLLINSCLNKAVLNKNSVAVLFSGGLDSLSILLSCLEIGIRPVLYSFYLQSYESEDIKSARKVAKLYNLELKEIRINDDSIHQLIDDVFTIIDKYKVHKKTAVQCIYPFLYVVPQINEKYVLTGLCADDLYGTPLSMAKHRNNHIKFNSIREERIKDVSASSFLQIKTLVEEFDKIMVAPYKEDNDVVNYFRMLSYKEMNSPKQKHIMYQAYKRYIDEGRLYRRNQSLQCGSKIRELHDSLLTTELNIKHYKVVNPIYRNIYNNLFARKETFRNG